MSRILASAVAVVAFAGCGGAVPDEEIAGRGTGEAAVEQAEARTDSWAPCGFTAKRVKDIYPGPPGSSPEGLIHADDVLVFSGDDGTHGREPWSSSGEGHGTRLLKDLRAGTAGSDPTLFTRVGDTVFFVADDGTSGRELWKTDGTPSGTRRVKDIQPGAIGSDPRNLTVFKGRLYFTADDGVHGRELWRSDGTSGGTRLVHNLTPDALTASGYELAVAGDFLYIKYITFRVILVRTDGTADGFVQLLNFVRDNSIRTLTAVGDRLFFIHNNDEPEWSLYVTDGSPAGTRRLRFFPDDPHDLAAFHGQLYFASGRGTLFDEPDYAGDELWRSDGTVSGTVLVKDLRPGVEGSVPRGLTVFKDFLFFTADDGVHGRELWRSDGTESGTLLLEDFELGPVGSSPEGLVGHGTRLFFSADTTGRGREPWMHDGGIDGATPLDEIAPGPASSSPGIFVRSGWDLFFAADDGVTGRELWALPFRPPGRCGPPAL
ncbi:ELWxxDGT repeat protein [Archangium lansingense]|uniref:ELWxxDGT repeat protein n=1 Tax=Archangium lansingense TaxID=2995310 RepID=UPI003B7F69D5